MKFEFWFWKRFNLKNCFTSSLYALPSHPWCFQSIAPETHTNSSISLNLGEQTQCKCISFWLKGYLGIHVSKVCGVRKYKIFFSLHIVLMGLMSKITLSFWSGIEVPILDFTSLSSRRVWTFSACSLLPFKGLIKFSWPHVRKEWS